MVGGAVPLSMLLNKEDLQEEAVAHRRDLANPPPMNDWSSGSSLNMLSGSSEASEGASRKVRYPHLYLPFANG